MQIINRANLSPDTHIEIERLLPEFGTLQQFVAWGIRQQLPALLLDTIPLDEYTQEVISAWHDGLFLIFSST